MAFEKLDIGANSFSPDKLLSNIMQQNQQNQFIPTPVQSYNTQPAQEQSAQATSIAKSGDINPGNPVNKSINSFLLSLQGSDINTLLETKRNIHKMIVIKDLQEHLNRIENEKDEELIGVIMKVNGELTLIKGSLTVPQQLEQIPNPLKTTYRTEFGVDVIIEPTHLARVSD